MKFDLLFYYKYNLRFILINKFSLININEIPNFKKLLLFFSVQKLEDLSRSDIYNYAYLFKFFFGFRAFLSNYKSYFSLGNWSYSLKVSVIVGKKLFLFNTLSILINDFFFKVDSNLLKKGVYCSNKNIFFLVLKDMNIFSEKKTNLGLFNLHSDLNIHIFVKGGSFFINKNLLKNFKYSLC